MDPEKNNIHINWDYSEKILSEIVLSEQIDKLIFQLLGRSFCELTLLVTDDRIIQMYNQQTRDKELPTDVLSYPQDYDLNHPVVDLGQIIISMDTCFRQAKELEVDVTEEFYRLLVHGLLHLLGYDHEASEEEAIIMRTKEDECLELIISK